MAFKVVFHAPDADPEKNRCVVETSKCKLFVVEVKSQDQAVEVCKDLAKKEKVDSIILCPGFTHKEVAQLSEVARGNVGVFVARGDGPSNRASSKARQRGGYRGRQTN